MRMIPNALAVARGLAAVPVVLLVIDRDLAMWSLAVFAVAALTDALDGALARRLDATTPVGAFLDPLADKILVLGTLIALLIQDAVAAWAVAAILGREVLAVGLRSAGVLRGVAIEATVAAKAKTVLQFVAVAGLLLAHAVAEPGVSAIAMVLLSGAVALTLVSGAELAFRVSPHFVRERVPADAR